MQTSHSQNPEPPASSRTDLPTCPCGYDRFSPFVSPVPKYSFLATILVQVIGITFRPLEITYKCRRCNTSIEKRSDDATIDYYMESPTH